MALKPVSFVYNNDDSEDATKHIGFIAPFSLALPYRVDEDLGGDEKVAEILNC